MKFSNKDPFIFKTREQWELWDLRQEFEKLLAQHDLVQLVALSYVDPCVLAKYRINNLS